MLEKVIDKAKRDPEVAKLLREIAALDALLPSGAFAVSGRMARELLPILEEIVPKISRLCSEVAQRIVGPGEDAEDMAEWLSYNVQQVVRELG